MNALTLVLGVEIVLFLWGGLILSTLFLLQKKTTEKVNFEIFLLDKKKPKLTGVSTDLVSPRPYSPDHTPLKMSSFGCKNNSLKRWIVSTPPPNQN